MKRPNIMLVGLGVVGRAIMQAHLDAGLCVTIADQNKEAVNAAIGGLKVKSADWDVSESFSLCESLGEFLCAANLRYRHPPIPTANGSDSQVSAANRPILIESIAERLQVKRDFFQIAESVLDPSWILCSNTSTLRIAEIAQSLAKPERVCGMHFFMPVDSRTAVEVVRSSQSSHETIERCADHVKRISKIPLVVADSPGFIVNRMLSPYLNEAMLLLAEGVTAERIEQAALEFGMPMSPLQLSDLIGLRTMFDAGRVYWQAFPARIDPSPILPGLLKAGRAGSAVGHGFYDYDNDQRSADLSPQTKEICSRYARGNCEVSDRDVLLRLSVPMWIESALLLREAVAEQRDQVELAMSGGLGFERQGQWYDFFDALGNITLHHFLQRSSKMSKALVAPEQLSELLITSVPSRAIDVFSQAR